MRTKHEYVRSKKLLKMVASLDCQACGSGHMVQAAHTNWGGGKGRGIKADDNQVAALCLKCHYEVDQCKDFIHHPEDERVISKRHVFSNCMQAETKIADLFDVHGFSKI